MLDQALDAVKRSRRTDPDTSMAAAEKAAPVAAEHKELILGLLLLVKRPMGGTEIARRLGLTQVQVCRRLPELKSAGHIRVAEGEGRTQSGRAERLWEVA